MTELQNDGENNRKRHILDLNPTDWSNWFAKQGQPSYRCDQMIDWIYHKMEPDPENMTNLSKELRALILDSFSCRMPKVVNKEVSKDGRTVKYGIRLTDGEVIESVLMEQDKRNTFCISTQVGCKLGCRFCSTARMGFKRNLTTVEILAQIIILASDHAGVGNIVFMGMGEPLQNTESLLPALEAIVDEKRIGLGRRRVTVSTAGIEDGIIELGKHDSRPNLALSLNSPYGPQRTELMPVNRKYPLADVLAACERYSSLTGRRIMLEYVMLGGVNTAPDTAEEVADIAQQLYANVNLIVFNKFPESPYSAPDTEEVEEFRKVLEKRGVTVTERFRRGREIAAACGQLRGFFI